MVPFQVKTSTVVGISLTTGVPPIELQLLRRRCKTMVSGNGGVRQTFKRLPPCHDFPAVVFLEHHHKNGWFTITFSPRNDLWLDPKHIRKKPLTHLSPISRYGSGCLLELFFQIPVGQCFLFAIRIRDKVLSYYVYMYIMSNLPSNVRMNESSTLTLTSSAKHPNNRSRPQWRILRLGHGGFGIFAVSGQWQPTIWRKLSRLPGKRGGSDTIHVWHIYLHLVDFYGKCR